jgi:hypothetical protein
MRISSNCVCDLNMQKHEIHIRKLDLVLFFASAISVSYWEITQVIRVQAPKLWLMEEGRAIWKPFTVT